MKHEPENMANNGSPSVVDFCSIFKKAWGEPVPPGRLIFSRVDPIMSRKSLKNHRKKYPFKILLIMPFSI